MHFAATTSLQRRVGIHSAASRAQRSVREPIVRVQQPRGEGGRRAVPQTRLRDSTAVPDAARETRIVPVMASNVSRKGGQWGTLGRRGGLNFNPGGFIGTGAQGLRVLGATSGGERAE